MRKMEIIKHIFHKKTSSMFSESICIFKNVDFKEEKHEDLEKKVKKQYETINSFCYR